MKKVLPVEFTPERSLLTFIKQTNEGCTPNLARGLYLCKCGNTTEAYIGNVKSGKTLSCGCHRKSISPNLKHGLSEHPLYSVWENMISRCYNPNVKAYLNYGGRGVVMCDEWHYDPESFIKWGIENGWELGLELDKDIKGNGLLYSPETCKFVTTKENSNNRRVSKMVTYNGETYTLAQWADKIGISQSTLCIRLKRWSVERALTEPINFSKPNKRNEV